MTEAFVDTSAILALVNSADRRHRDAAGCWRRFLDGEAPLTTTNYVLLETFALLQRRQGAEAVRGCVTDVQPMLDIVWVDTDLHAAALAAFLGSGRRGPSLVDCVSFEAMRRRGIRVAFAFDPHFARQGFELVP